RAIPGFAFGVWLHAHHDEFSTALARYRPALLLKVALVVMVVLMVVRVDQYATLALVWLVVTLAYACDRAGTPTWLSVNWLASRGPLTYSLYMLHPLVATVFLAVLFPRLLGTSLPARTLGVLASLPVLYLAAVVSLRYFEAPARRAIVRLGGAEPERPHARA
ncbi:MAG: acyltransferase family protein, partial [Polymorphobacter sp.]